MDAIVDIVQSLTVLILVVYIIKEINRRTGK